VSAGDSILHPGGQGSSAEELLDAIAAAAKTRASWTRRWRRWRVYWD